MPVRGYFAGKNVPKLENVPILVGADGSFPIEANRYLDERCLGEWIPPWLRNSREPGDHDDPVIPTLKTRKNLTAYLLAFLRWCEQDASRDWKQMTYHEHLLGDFQVGLVNGTGSASGKRLGNNSVNHYINEAGLFLTWAAERGYRPAFKVPRRRCTQKGNGAPGASRTVSARIGALQGKPFDLDWLPTAAEVQVWLREVATRAPAKALIFEFICRCNPRISEANLMRIGCFPRKTSGANEDQWPRQFLAQGYVPLLLRYGVKGQKVSPASDLSVKSRRIEVPIDLADRMWDYLQISRPTLLSRFHRGKNARLARTDRFWVGEYTNQPVSNQALYDAWVSPASCPEHWHPHMGRHFFAVQKIIEATNQLLTFHLINDVNGVSIGWLHGLMAGQVRLILSPLMGHVDEKTTMIYLRCALRHMVQQFGHPMSRWNAIIDFDCQPDAVPT